MEQRKQNALIDFSPGLGHNETIINHQKNSFFSTQKWSGNKIKILHAAHVILLPSSVHWVQTMCCMCRDSFFFNSSGLACTHTSLIPCFLYFSVTFNANRMREEEGEEKNGGSTKESLKTVTSRWLPGLTVLKQYYYYYAACSLVKTTPPALVAVDGEKNWVRGERVSHKLPTKSSGAREREGSGLRTGTPSQDFVYV